MVKEVKESWWNSPLTAKKVLTIIIWIILIVVIINIILAIFVMKWGSELFT